MFLACWLMLPTEVIHAVPDSRVDEPEKNGQAIYFPNLSYHNFHDYEAPSTPYPVDKAIDVSINTFFRWNDNPITLPDDTSPFQFEVFMAPGGSPSAQPIARLSRNALDTITLAPNTQYTWQIVAIDAAGRRFPGPEWTFRTLVVPGESSEIADFGAMVNVPAGEFIMGCDRNNPYYQVEENCTGPNDGASGPLHVVYLDAYEIDKYEVTNAEYEACVVEGECSRPRKPRAGNLERYGLDEYANYPVVYVSWDNAQDYCAWQGKRLPTEAEWEKAARGSIDTRAWPWGNEQFKCDRMNFSPGDRCPDWVEDVAPVGSSPKGMGPYGGLDMAGNVSEWVKDKYDWTYYSRSPYANPQGSDVSRVYNSLDATSDEWGYPTYVLRGGDYWGWFMYHFTYYRYFGHWGEAAHVDDIPLFRNKRTGFRCARSVE